MPTGKVKYFNNDKGYGFIAADDGSADVFCHAKECKAERGSFLEVGDAVTFEVAFDEQKGKDAAWSLTPWRAGGNPGPGMPMSGPEGGDKICRDFQAGKCNRDRCKFSHGGRSRSPNRQQGGFGGQQQQGFGGFPQQQQFGGFPQQQQFGGMPGFQQQGFPQQQGGMQLPPGWEQVTDPSSGRPYYCNRSTGETSWTPPPAPMQMQMQAPAPPPMQPAAPGGLPPGWEAAQDPGSGKTYFFNRATNVTQWDPPHC